MKKLWIALLGVLAIASALAAGYFLNSGNLPRGLLFLAISLALLGAMVARMRSPQDRKANPILGANDPPAINLAFYGELNRLIDEGKDISGYLRGCDAPQNIVKSVNIGGATRWYYHRDNMPFDQFSAEIPHDETAQIVHPYVKEQRVDAGTLTDIQYITVDLYRALWDWGEKNPSKRRYANSMRIAFHGAYQPSAQTGDNNYLDKTIEQVRAERKANKKKPKKEKNKKDTDI